MIGVVAFEIVRFALAMIGACYLGKCGGAWMADRKIRRMREAAERAKPTGWVMLGMDGKLRPAPPPRRKTDTP